MPAPANDASPRATHATFCELMKHGLAIDVLACPCGERMTFRATIFEREELGRWLRAKGLPDRIEPIRSARAPPQGDLDLGA